MKYFWKHQKSKIASLTSKASILNKLFSEIFFLISLIIITNSIFIMVSHPLTIGLILIVQTLIIAFFSRLFLPSFWFSYILILVFMGGLLVLFVYVSTLASNEQINISPPYLFIFLTLLIFLVLLLIWTPREIFTLTDNSQLDYSYSWIFSLPLISLSFFLIVYLFIVLVAIVKITKFWGGAIRPAN